MDLLIWGSLFYLFKTIKDFQSLNHKIKGCLEKVSFEFRRLRVANFQVQLQLTGYGGPSRKNYAKKYLSEFRIWKFFRTSTLCPKGNLFMPNTKARNRVISRTTTLNNFNAISIIHKYDAEKIIIMVKQVQIFKW